LALTGLVVVLLVVVFGPVLAKVKGRLEMRKKFSSQFSQLDEKVNILTGIDQNLIKQRVERMERVFPSKKPVVELLASLSQLAADHGLSFGGVTLRPGVLTEEGGSDLEDLRFGFLVGGDYISISQFLKDLENVAPLMKIDGVGLTIKTNPLFKREVVSVAAEINVSAFYQPPPETLGPVSTPVSLLTKRQEEILNKLLSFRTFEVILPVAPTGKVDLFAVP